MLVRVIVVAPAVPKTDVPKTGATVLLMDPERASTEDNPVAMDGDKV